ncbi:MAG: hypothetical protein ACJ8IK_00325 [Burkholderiaceae bacterium]
MKVQRIWGADICRDGGSYSLCFDADDGRWYELFVKTRAFETAPSTSHHPPAIYLEGANGGEVVRHLSWSEAREFIAPLSYEGDRFAELRQVIETAGTVR